MEINDEGIIIGQKKYGENYILIDIFSKFNGLIRGLYRPSKKRNKVNLTDNIQFVWKSRNFDGLGFVKFEINESFFSIIDNFSISLIKASICEICLKLLPKGEKNKKIYVEFLTLMIFYKNKNKDLNYENFKFYIIWELSFLKHLGYALDIGKCAVTSEIKELDFISPRTGRAVTKKIGEPWKSKLFKLPKFFINSNHPCIKEDLIEGLKITNFFLKKINYSVGYDRKFRFIFKDEIYKKIINS